MMPSRISLDLAHGRQADLRHERGSDTVVTDAWGVDRLARPRWWRALAPAGGQLRPA